MIRNKHLKFDLYGVGILVYSYGYAYPNLAFSTFYCDPEEITYLALFICGVAEISYCGNLIFYRKRKKGKN